MIVPPGLTCARCTETFGGDRPARRTSTGYVHVSRCNQGAPAVLTGGRWVHERGVARWVAS